MHASSMKDRAKKSNAGKVESKKRSTKTAVAGRQPLSSSVLTKGATRLKQKEKFSIKKVFSIIPLWFIQSIFVVSLFLVAGWGLQQVRWGWAVEQVEIEGEFRYWQAKDLAKQLLWVKQQNFFSLDVRQVKYELEQLALIKSAQVKKVWPDTLLVKFKEDIPVAIWNKDALLNPKGEELLLPGSFDQSSLPRLFGPELKTEQVMRQFQRFQSRLSAVDAVMVSLTMNAIGSWEIELENGWAIRLGRQQLEQRIERLIELLKILPQEKVAVVDLRYGKGAAIKWLPA
jgi:cell division protein FtsQ